MREKILRNLEELVHFGENKNKQDIIDNYLTNYMQVLKHLSEAELVKECVSGYNRFLRAKTWASTSFNIEVSVGDVCFIDFGHAYINEVGFQHFALVLNIFNHKLWVAPMTSNLKTFHQGINISESGKTHLFSIGKVDGLHKPSVIFLNDVRFINSSRVISINARIDPQSGLFKSIIRELKGCLFTDHYRWDSQR